MKCVDHSGWQGTAERVDDAFRGRLTVLGTVSALLPDA
jgi:hypothetical protein